MRSFLFALIAPPSQIPSPSASPSHAPLGQRVVNFVMGHSFSVPSHRLSSKVLPSGLKVRTLD
eukprot:2673348-Pyramimonas_sp.AAC.1